MAIEFTCPACGGALRVRDAAVGQVVRCGGCMTMLRVPDVEPVPSPSPSFPGAEPEPPPRSAPRPAPTPPPRPASDPDFPNPSDAPLRPVRGTRFWLTVTVATLALGTCGCCGLAALILPGPEWRPYESEQGGFRVELPADPQDMRKRLGVQQGKVVEGTHLWTRAENYAVTYWDRPGGFLKPDEQFLEEQMNALATGRDVRKVTRTDKIEVDGFPAREFEYETRNGGTYTGRMIVTSARVYVLLAGGRFTQPDNENVRRFLDSFEFSDPKLVAEGKQRGDLAVRGLEQLQQRRARDELRDAGAAAGAAAFAAVEAELVRE
jgi:hypothetical protein